MSRTPLDLARAEPHASLLPRRTLYRTRRAWLRPPVTRFLRLTVEGAEHLPLHRPFDDPIGAIPNNLERPDPELRRVPAAPGRRDRPDHGRHRRPPGPMPDTAHAAGARR